MGKDDETFQPRCSVCEAHTASVTLKRSGNDLKLSYSGPGGGTGLGGVPISNERASAIRRAFTPPYSSKAIAAADLYDDGGYCRDCEQFYCASHWNMSSTGGGHCPKGHFKSLDPHWSPAD